MDQFDLKQDCLRLANSLQSRFDRHQPRLTTLTSLSADFFWRLVQRIFQPAEIPPLDSFDCFNEIEQFQLLLALLGQIFELDFRQINPASLHLRSERKLRFLLKSLWICVQHLPGERERCAEQAAGAEASERPAEGEASAGHGSNAGDQLPPEEDSGLVHAQEDQGDEESRLHLLSSSFSACSCFDSMDDLLSSCDELDLAEPQDPELQEAGEEQSKERNQPRDKKEVKEGTNTSELEIMESTATLLCPPLPSNLMADLGRLAGQKEMLRELGKLKQSSFALQLSYRIFDIIDLDQKAEQLAKGIARLDGDGNGGQLRGRSTRSGSSRGATKKRIEGNRAGRSAKLVIRNSFNSGRNHLLRSSKDRSTEIRFNRQIEQIHYFNQDDEEEVDDGDFNADLDKDHFKLDEEFNLIDHEEWTSGRSSTAKEAAKSTMKSISGGSENQSNNFARNQVTRFAMNQVAHFARKQVTNFAGNSSAKDGLRNRTTSKAPTRSPRRLDTTRSSETFPPEPNLSTEPITRKHLVEMEQLVEKLSGLPVQTVRQMRDRGQRLDRVIRSVQQEQLQAEQRLRDRLQAELHRERLRQEQLQREQHRQRVSSAERDRRLEPVQQRKAIREMRTERALLKRRLDEQHRLLRSRCMQLEAEQERRLKQQLDSRLRETREQWLDVRTQLRQGERAQLGRQQQVLHNYRTLYQGQLNGLGERLFEQRQLSAGRIRENCIELSRLETQRRTEFLANLGI